jgi:hypothetical protein
MSSFRIEKQPIEKKWIIVSGSTSRLLPVETTQPE